METTKHHIEPAAGRLGVLMVGLGAVASTVIAGVELIRRGLAEPVGSLTQMGTIRLGKRTENRAPLIKDFVPLADLKDLVFGAWDPIPDDAYTAAKGVVQDMSIAVHCSRFVGVATTPGSHTRTVKTPIIAASNCAARRGTMPSRTPAPAAM